MKMKITNIEPRYLEISTHEARNHMIEYYKVEFCTLSIGMVQEFSGTLIMDDIDTHENLIRKIKEQIILLLNAKN